MSEQVKLKKADGSYVTFDSLTVRQLEVLEKFSLIMTTALNKKLSDKDVGFAVKQICRDI